MEAQEGYDLGPKATQLQHSSALHCATLCTSESVLKLTTSRKPLFLALLESHHPQLPEKEDMTQLPRKQGEDGRGKGGNTPVLIIESWCRDSQAHSN